MRNMSSFAAILGLTLIFVVGVQEDAEAQRRGGRSRTGTYQRTNSQGQTRSGTWSQNRQRERGKNYRKANSETQVNTERGTWKRERNNSVERTGEGSYDRSWERTTTSPNGTSRTWEGQGSGTVERTEGGSTRTYQGTATSPKGNEYGVDKVTTRTKTDSGWEKSTTKTVTDSDGNVVGSGERNSVGTQGEGVTTTGSWTNENQGTRSRQARWQYIDGRWVRSGENSDGGSSTTTITTDDEE